MKPPFAYYGGKTTIAERIVELLPEHQHYVEPFGGSLAVLLAKPSSKLETVNDLDQALMTFWRVLRTRPDELAAAAALPDDGLTDHCGCCAHRRSTGCGGKDCPCAQATPESSKQARARTVACSWCGRSIYEADGRWLATKGKERGYDPLLCDANDDDGAHEPAVEGSSTAPGGDEGV